MKTTAKTLTGLHIFNGITAVGGGLSLMAGVIKDVPEWTVQTAFNDLYFPGLILFALVGGSALLAAMALSTRVQGAQLTSFLAGLIMLFWIIGEIVSIRAFHLLQVIYLVTSLSILFLTIKYSEATK